MGSIIGLGGSLFGSSGDRIGAAYKWEEHSLKSRGFILGIILVTGTVAFGADIYIDPTYSGANGPENGTFLRPYNSWTDVTISADNDYFQKCGTTFTGTLNINTSGTAANPILIGAYYESGGSPVYEHNSPRFGENCDNSSPKPIIRDSNDNGNVIAVDAQYIIINSFEIQYGSEAVAIKNNNNLIEYCHIGQDSNYGIRIGQTPHTDGDNNLIRYNIIDGHDSSANLPDHSQEGICFQWRAANNTAHNNYIAGWYHSCIFFNSGDSNETYNNYCLGREQDYPSEGFLWNFSADDNIVHHNWVENTNLQIQGGQRNEIYSNVINNFTSNGCNGTNATREGAIVILNETGYPSDDNMIFNNTIHNTLCRGLVLYARSAETGGSVSNNEFTNNVIWGVNNWCIFINDEVNEISGNTWNNNLCYGYGINQYARIMNVTTYECASNCSPDDEFNDRADASGNLDIDPQLQSATELWPSSASSNVVGSGYTLTAPYNQLINPNSDFTAFPPLVNTVTQSGYIGAYALPGSPPVNLAPIVNAGADQSITLPTDIVSLDGTVTDDGLPDPPAVLTTLWIKQSGPGTVTFGNANAIDTTASFSAAGTYVLRLTADDSDLQTHDDVTITVDPDTTPPAMPSGLEIIE